MKKVFFLMCALLLISATSVKSQVTMGSLDDPHPGAVLDLKNENSAKLGLKLPNVALNVDPYIFVLEGLEDKDTAAGMVVYNTAEVQCGPGVYYWDGNKWNPVTACPEPRICDFPEQPGGMSLSESAVCLNSTFTASVTNVSGLTYNWSLPSGLTGSSTTNSIEITGEAAGIYAVGEISVTASNDCGTSEASSSITAVTVTEAFTQDNPTAAVTVLNEGTYTFSLAAATGGSGALTYQWQSSANGSTWTNISGATNAAYTTPALTATDYANNTKVPYYYRRQATRATCGGTITSATATVTAVPCGAYIAADTPKQFMCHNLGATTSLPPFTPAAGIHGAKYKWGTEVVALTQAEDQNPANDGGFGSTWASMGGTPPSTEVDWNMSTDKPCPTGFRVPTQAEWDNVINNNTWTSVGDWANNATNYSSGKQIGTALFLPTTGCRISSDGALSSRGFIGYYQSSTVDNGASAHYLYFRSSSTYQYTNSADKSAAYSVRCIAE